MKWDTRLLFMFWKKRSMGQVDESKSIFTLDIYFRQYWTDKRLLFNETRVDELVLNWQFLTWIWRPDTYFLNGQVQNDN